MEDVIERVAEAIDDVQALFGSCDATGRRLRWCVVASHHDFPEKLAFIGPEVQEADTLNDPPFAVIQALKTERAKAAIAAL